MMWSVAAHAAEPLSIGAEVWTAAVVAAEGESDTPQTPPAPLYAEGNWDLQFYMGAVEDFSGDGTVMHATLAVEYFLYDDIALVGEFQGIKVAQDGDDPEAFGFNLLARWHFDHWGDVSPYFEGGVGVFNSFDARVPPHDGTHFNFTLHLGLGLKWRLADRISFIAAARYYHLSNAYRRGVDRNPSLDAVGGYGGIEIRF